MSNPAPPPINVDSALVLSAHLARTRQLLAEHAAREATYLEEISHLEAYISMLTAQTATEGTD